MEDPSKDKPSFFQHTTKRFEETDHAPEMIPAKRTVLLKEKKLHRIHTINYSEQTIEKDGFKVLVDAEGNLLTDVILLAKLRELRKEIASEYNVPPYRIMFNSTLVLLATDKPTAREEFIEIKGITISMYLRFGERFIAEINKHIDS